MVHVWEDYTGKISAGCRIVVVREVVGKGRKEWDWERHTVDLSDIDNYYFLKSWVAGIWLFI